MEKGHWWKELCEEGLGSVLGRSGLGPEALTQAKSPAVGPGWGLDGSQGAGELASHGLPVFSAAHHHPTYEPKTITTGRRHLGELGFGANMFCDVRPVTSPSEPISTSVQWVGCHLTSGFPERVCSA